MAAKVQSNFAIWKKPTPRNLYGLPEQPFKRNKQRGAKFHADVLKQRDLVLYERTAHYTKLHLNATENLEQIFQELKAQWEIETQYVSSASDITENLNYLYIIGMGPDVIPFLLKDLAETQSLWFWALTIISRENPVSEEDEGDVEKMTEAWLEWGQHKGYI